MPYNDPKKQVTTYLNHSTKSYRSDEKIMTQTAKPFIPPAAYNPLPDMNIAISLPAIDQADVATHLFTDVIAVTPLNMQPYVITITFTETKLTVDPIAVDAVTALTPYLLDMTVKGANSILNTPAAYPFTMKVSANGYAPFVKTVNGTLTVNEVGD